MVSEKETGCDDIDMDDKGDRSGKVTRLIGRKGLQKDGLHWALLGCSGLCSAVLVCAGLF